MSKSPDVGGVAAEQLQSLIMRIERLEEDKANITADIREVFNEAKGQGLDVKIMKQVISLRKMEESDAREQAEILDLYKRALGMEV